MKYFIFSLFFTGLLFLWSCELDTNSSNDSNYIVYSTSAEDTDGEFFTNSEGDILFRGADFQNQDFSRTGKSSIKLDSTNLYGFSIIIEDPKEGELYQASVWQKKGAKDGTLACTIDGTQGRTIRTWKSNSEHKEWFRHSMNLIIGKDVNSLSFYVFAGGNDAYFDDITVKRYPKIPELEEPVGQTLNIHIPDSSNQKLEKYVEKALAASIIESENKKYVNAFIVDGYDSIPISMRLKGDWTDHLTSGKISYRIKVDGNHSFMGLKTFSIQHPRTRNNMHEWFMHELSDREDLLSTKYDMISVKINGVNKGTYALEEHFDKQLLESRKRREGPILKLDESGLWAIAYQSSLTGKNKSFPYYCASFENVFKKKRTLKKPGLRRQFEEGSKLLELFKNNSKQVDAIFDMKKTAKFYALMELGNVEHTYAWHNRRFYFNPISQKLELVGYDMLPGEILENELYIYHKMTSGSGPKELQMTKMILKNESFRSHYTGYLKQFSDSTYLNLVFDELDSDIKIKEKMLALEIEDYYFDRQFYLNRAEIIRRDMFKLDSAWQVYMNSDVNRDSFITKSHYTPNLDTFFIEEISLNAYRHKIDSSKYALEFENYHLNQMTIIGYKIKGDTLYILDNPIILPAFSDENNVEKTNLVVNKKAKEIVFEISNHPGKIYTKKVMKWERPKGITSRMELEKSFQINSPYYKIKDSLLTFKKGSYSIDKLLYIPSKYKVLIMKGTNIDFINGGGIIANNSFEANGTEQESIHIYSSDGNNHGLTILQGDKVNMAFVNFDSLNTLHYKKWQLTGAVSIYESEIKITNCRITNNTSEDGLNIIRSNFMIDSLFVSGTKSDGFDADFCTGEIKNSRFENTGNDCIDFSGSKVQIANIEILNSGDKGISGGERSELTIFNININGAITGVAAKDDTQISGDKVFVTNAEFGVAAFQKKAEYNRGIVQLTNVEYTNLRQFGLVELGSYAVINSKYYYGAMVIDIEKLYARFEK